jgi:hypothetical protein
LSAWIRAFRAEIRAMRIARITSTFPSLVFGVLFDSPCGVQAQESDVAWSEDCRMDGRVPRGCKRSSSIDREMRRELRRRLCVAGGVRMVLHRNSTRFFEPYPDRPRHVRSSSDRVPAQNSVEAIDSLNL